MFLSGMLLSDDSAGGLHRFQSKVRSTRRGCATTNSSSSVANSRASPQPFMNCYSSVTLIGRTALVWIRSVPNITWTVSGVIQS